MKEATLKATLLGDFNYMLMFWERPNYVDKKKKKNQWLPGFGSEVMKRQSTEISRQWQYSMWHCGDEHLYLYLSKFIEWVTPKMRILNFLKFSVLAIEGLVHAGQALYHRVTSTAPKMNLNVNCGLWLVTVYQCRFIDCNKSATMVLGVDQSEGYACGEIYVLSPILLWT